MNDRDDLPPSGPIGDCSSVEGNAVERYFRGRNVDDVSLADLKKNYPHDPAAILAFMTDDAVAYYLPAFMQISLEKYEEAGSIPEAVIYRILDVMEADDRRALQAIIQRRGISGLIEIETFLQAMSDRYWHRYPNNHALRALSLLRSIRETMSRLNQ